MRYDHAGALAGSPAPPEVLAAQQLVDIVHLDLAGHRRTGQLVVHERLADEVTAIFAGLVELGFPLARVEPIVAFGWDDEASMTANNTSAFCWRPVAGTAQPSWHSYGVALDLNPAFNPYGDEPDTWHPPGARYDTSRPGTLADDADCPLGREVIRRFEANGWQWLGRRAVARDRHHFHKPSVLGRPRRPPR